MKHAKLTSALALAALAAAGAANALGTTVTVNFDKMPAAVYGRANVAPLSSGLCPLWLGGGCYVESNVVVGTLNDTTSAGNGGHIHAIAYGTVASPQKGLAYHSDSPGVFIRMKDRSAFKLKSMYFAAPKNGDNPDTGTADYWNIYGFSTSTYPAATTSSPLLNLVAVYKVKNGFTGTLTLPAGFQNVKSVWINYNGYPKTPVDPDMKLDPETGEVVSDGPKQAKRFAVTIDNMVLTPPTGAVCQ